MTETQTIGALGTYTTTWSYNSQDQVVSMRYPDPTPDAVETGEIVTTTYNIAGQPATLSSSLVGGELGAMTYNAQGQPKLITYTAASQVTHYGYYGYNHWGIGDSDDAPDQSWAEGHVGQLWKLCTVPAGVACPQAGDSSSLLDLRYGYDAVGNITSLRDKTGGADELQSFTYDALDRLAGASGPYSQSYSYDAIGNLTYRSDVGAYSYNSGRPHAVTVAGSHSYGYNANGNVISRAGDSLTYDAENRLQSVTSGGETVTFTYDGDGRRVMRDTVTDTVAYIGPHYELRFDKASKPEDLDNDCRITTIDIMRVAAQWGEQGPDIPEDVNDDQIVDIADIQQVAGAWRETCHVLADTTKYYSLGGQRIAMRKAGTLYYLFADHLGSTSVTYNTANSQTQTLRYYPWGAVRSGDIPTDRRFTGQRWDSTIGLYDYNARWYDAALGRFVQADTVVPNPGNPQSLNRYSYVYNNPLNYTDPTGRCVNNDRETTRGDAFDCSVDELAGLGWGVRTWWLGLLSDAAGVNGWFNNVNDIITFFSQNPLLDDLSGWASWADAGVLQAIQGGFRLSRGKAAIGTSEAAGLWRVFFSEYHDPGMTDHRRKELWGPAEKAGVRYGIAVADARVGRPGGFTGLLIENFVTAGDLYRDLVGTPGAGRQMGSAAGSGIGYKRCGGPCAVVGGVAGHHAGEWFTDPRSRGPSYLGAWAVTALTVDQAIRSPRSLLP